jgi:hypothetical protein
MQFSRPGSKRIGFGAADSIYWDDSSTSRTTSNLLHGFAMNVVPSGRSGRLCPEVTTIFKAGKRRLAMVASSAPVILPARSTSANIMQRQPPTFSRTSSAASPLSHWMTYVRFLQIEYKRTIAADIGVSPDTVDRASRKSSTARGQAVERRLGGACWGFPLDLRRNPKSSAAAPGVPALFQI